MTSLEKAVGCVPVTTYWGALLVCSCSPQEVAVQFHGVSVLWDVFMLGTLVLSPRDSRLQCITGMSCREAPEESRVRSTLLKSVSDFSTDFNGAVASLSHEELYESAKEVRRVHKKCVFNCQVT